MTLIIPENTHTTRSVHYGEEIVAHHCTFSNQEIRALHAVSDDALFVFIGTAILPKPGAVIEPTAQEELEWKLLDQLRINGLTISEASDFIEAYRIDFD